MMELSIKHGRWRKMSPVQKINSFWKENFRRMQRESPEDLAGSSSGSGRRNLSALAEIDLLVVDLKIGTYTAA
jgi:hypothetical protein